MGRFVLRRTLTPSTVPVAPPKPEKGSNQGPKRAREETAAQAWGRLFPDAPTRESLGPITPPPVRLDSLAPGRRFVVPHLPNAIYTFLRRKPDGMCQVWYEGNDLLLEMDGLRSVEYRDVDERIERYEDLPIDAEFRCICASSDRARNTVYTKHSRYMAVTSRGMGIQVPSHTVVLRVT